MRKIVFAVLGLIFLSAVFSGCGGKSESVTRSNFMLDTVVSVTLYGTGDSATIDELFDEARRLESLLGAQVEGSDVWRINEGAGKEYVRISAETFHVIERALYYSELADGLFDITVGPLIDLWDISGGGYVPSEQEKAAAMEMTGYEKVLISGGSVMLQDEGMSINLGAIAKGYIGDRLREMLIEKGVDHAIINLGGNVIAIGGKNTGTPFVVGIQNPFESNGAISAAIEIFDGSLVSSGNYERYFEVDGIRYHHILNPFTGAPSDSGLAGSTIICDSSEDADALSTIVFLLGAEKGLALIESIEETECVLITGQGEIICSSGVRDRLIVNQ